MYERKPVDRDRRNDRDAVALVELEVVQIREIPRYLCQGRIAEMADRMVLRVSLADARCGMTFECVDDVQHVLAAAELAQDLGKETRRPAAVDAHLERRETEGDDVM